MVTFDNNTRCLFAIKYSYLYYKLLYIYNLKKKNIRTAIFLISMMFNQLDVGLLKLFQLL